MGHCGTGLLRISASSMTSPHDPIRPPLAPGDIEWLTSDPTRGGEQSGHHPVVVVASADFLEVVDTAVIVVPVTGSDRGWGLAPAQNR